MVTDIFHVKKKKEKNEVKEEHEI
jgi:hypothetical protein